MSTPVMGRPKKHFTEEALAQAAEASRRRYLKKRRDDRARAKHEQHRQDCLAVNRGFERRIRFKPAEPRLPFYPVVQKHVRYWPPPPLGSLAITMARMP